jgi:hypothetical protein
MQEHELQARVDVQEKRMTAAAYQSFVGWQLSGCRTQLADTWRAMENTPKATAPPPLGDVVSYAKALDACNVAMGWCEANAAKPLTAKVMRPSKETLALVTLAKHPDWTDAEIARNVGCNRTSLYRWRKYTQARELVEQGRNSLPTGSKDRDGNLEAWET